MFVPEDDTSMVSRESADRFYSLALVLDEINEGVTLLNEEAQLLWRNRAFDKLLVENREGHMLVAVILDFAGEFYRELQIDPTMETFKAYIINVGRVEHEMYFSLLPKGMLGQESFLLCVVKRLSSEWSNYEEQMRQNWSLTKREAQVAVECLRGKKNLEIASSLKISVSAVNKQLEKIYQKAGVRGRSELASRWIEDFK